MIPELAIGGTLLYLAMSKKSTPSNNKKITPPLPPDSEDSGKNPLPPIPPESEDVLNPLYKKIANQYGVAWQVLKTFAGIETNYGTIAWYKTRTPYYTKLGICGITQATFLSISKAMKRTYTASDAWKPDVSLEAASYLLIELSNRYGSTGFWDRLKTSADNGQEASGLDRSALSNMVMAWNVGPGNVNNPAYKTKAANYYTGWMNEYRKNIK
jgi:hypothetical protein